ncbi:MAG: ABC-type transport auxiliary lipoprotein family protein, partial [Marinomonas sp.]
MPISTYTLDKIPHNVARHHTNNISILVQTPTTKPIYDSTQMMYREKAYKISAYAVSEWAKTPAQMLQSLIVETLQKTSLFKA